MRQVTGIELKSLGLVSQPDIDNNRVPDEALYMLDDETGSHYGISTQEQIHQEEFEKERKIAYDDLLLIKEQMVTGDATQTDYDNRLAQWVQDKSDLYSDCENGCVISREELKQIIEIAQSDADNLFETLMIIEGVWS